MKKYIAYTIFAIIVICLISYFIYNKQIFKNDGAPISNDKIALNFCGSTYNFYNFKIISESDLSNISDIINYSYYKDNFPKPNSGDPIYKDMSETSQNIRYSFRPFMVAKAFCEELEANKEDQNINRESIIDSTYSFYINKTKISFEKSKLYKEIYVYPNADEDQSGMGGSYMLTK